MKKMLSIGAVVALVAVAVGIFISVKGAQSSENVQLKLAHNQAANSEIADTIAYLIDVVAEDPTMNMEVQIYASGVLGTEKEIIEMVQAGVLDIAKVSSNSVGQFENRYSIFALPYLFTGQEHYYEAMAKSEEVQKLFESNRDRGYITIGYYANGSRNFYLKENKPVTDPSVLAGLKIRAMPSSTSMSMIEHMGGSPVPMPASETYTTMQQGVIDGAENTELALTVDGHAELAKSYTYTEHQYSPDVYLISTKTWDRLSAAQQAYLKAAFVKINNNFTNMYNRMMEEAIVQAQQMGTTIYRDIDKTAF
ncbi:MAG: TRAP transporter substrate-binding protein DctP, partial [Deferribacteraceae bacterium]|nr:TRAP transporter substrate-binding protein DctP [Deferribacteraceae bacterium]